MAEKLSVMEQVALMLEKAKTTTPGEAEMLTARAEKLMIRHGLSEAMIENASPTVKDEPVVQTYVHYHNTFGKALSRIAGRTAEAMGTMRALYSGTKNDHGVYIIGHESDVQRVLPLIDSLVEQAHHAMRVWWKNEGKEQCYWMTTQDQWMARRQFYFSFADGVAARISEELREATDETPGSALVLVGRKERANQLATEMSGGRMAKGSKGSAVGQTAGWRAGQNAHRGQSIGS